MTLIGINVAVYLLQMAQGPHLEQFIFTYGLVPARYSVPFYAAHFTLGQQLFSLVSFMFLHGGFWHLLGNMWFLYIFGDNVEDRLGSSYYLAFYLAAGLISGLCHLLVNINSAMPTIGASGAIAGVMGAYLVLFPNARILTLIPIIIIPWIIEIPAFFFLGFLVRISAGQCRHRPGVCQWNRLVGAHRGVLIRSDCAKGVPGKIGARSRGSQASGDRSETNRTAPGASARRRFG